MAIGPNTYDFSFQTPNTFDEFLKGQQIAQQQELARQQVLQQQQAMQQQQEFARRVQAIQDKVGAGMATADDYAQLQLLDPKNSEGYKRAFETMDAGRRSNLFETQVPVYTALQNKRPEVAKQLIQNQIEAMKNSPQSPDTARRLQGAQLALSLIDQGPDGAVQAQLMLGSALQGMDPERFGKLVDSTVKQAEEGRKSQLFPEEFKQAQAKTTQEQAKASTAFDQAKLDLQKAGWDIKNLQSQIDDRKEQRKIALMNVQVAREGNSIKKQELQLKIADEQEKRADKLRQKATELTSAASTIDNLLNTADRILQNPRTDSVVGSIAGKQNTFVTDSAADAARLIESLDSQIFLAQVPTMKGLGALTEAEGARLTKGLQNISREQSPEQFRANIKEIQRIMTKARGNLEQKYGMSAGVPDTPAVKPSGKEITDLVNKYGN